MELIIEKAITHDIPELVKLEKACFQSDQLSVTHFRHLLSKANALVLVAKFENKIVGCAIVLFRKHSSSARLYSIAIHPDYHKKGFAKTLLEHSERAAHTNHCNQITLEVRKDNIAAITFYKKFGYEIFGEYQDYYFDGEDALRLRKTLHKRSQP